MKKTFSESGVGWVAGQAILMLLITAAAPMWSAKIYHPLVLILGLLLVALGAWSGIAGAVTLGRSRTIYPSTNQHAELIQHGIYGRLRHPLYTSLILISLGWSALWSSLASLFLALALAILLNFKADSEEALLSEGFPDYEAYRKRVPKFIPRIRHQAAPLALLSLLLFLGLSISAPGAIDLEDAIAEALENNPEAVLADKRMAAARSAVIQADSMLWPNLTLRSSYLRTDNPIGVFGAALNQRSFGPTLNFNNVPDADNLMVGGIVTVPLLTGGQIPAERSAARKAAQATGHLREAVKNQLAFEVTRLFLSIQKARAFVETAEAAVASYGNNLAIASKRLEAGKALKADVLDIEVRLAEAQEQLLNARNAQELARRAMANLLGREEGDSLPLPSGEPPVLNLPASTLPSERPELRSLESQQAAAESRERSARSGHRPKLSAFASAEQNHGWHFNGSGRNYTAGLMVNWNLFDGFMTQGKVDEARNHVEIIKEQKRQMRLAIDLEVQQARLNVQTARSRVEVSSKAVELASESAQLTRYRFEQGLALPTQLIDSETALTAARVRQAQARADHLIAIAAVRKALGLPQLTEYGKPH